jgi:hypothetical protein
VLRGSCLVCGLDSWIALRKAWLLLLLLLVAAP